MKYFKMNTDYKASKEYKTKKMIRQTSLNLLELDIIILLKEKTLSGLKTETIVNLSELYKFTWYAT